MQIRYHTRLQICRHRSGLQFQCFVVVVHRKSFVSHLLRRDVLVEQRTLLARMRQQSGMLIIKMFFNFWMITLLISLDVYGLQNVRLFRCFISRHQYLFLTRRLAEHLRGYYEIFSSTPSFGNLPARSSVVREIGSAAFTKTSGSRSAESEF